MPEETSTNGAILSESYKSLLEEQSQQAKESFNMVCWKNSPIEVSDESNIHITQTRLQLASDIKYIRNKNI